jgi:hypothetical protein
MTCFFPLVFLMTMSTHGPEKVPVPRQALLPELVEQINAAHSQCREKKLGQCLIEVVLKPATGHKHFLCGASKETQASD